MKVEENLEVSLPDTEEHPHAIRWEEREKWEGGEKRERLPIKVVEMAPLSFYLHTGFISLWNIQFLATWSKKLIFNFISKNILSCNFIQIFLSRGWLVYRCFYLRTGLRSISYETDHFWLKLIFTSKNIPSCNFIPIFLSLRVGWSVDQADLGLGEVDNSYGYGGTGKTSSGNKFFSYGEPYGPGDTIGCFLVSIIQWTKISKKNFCQVAKIFSWWNFYVYSIHLVIYLSISRHLR